MAGTHMYSSARIALKKYKKQISIAYKISCETLNNMITIQLELTELE